ncbi:hypothetical protein MNBD_GAMMA09-2928 [hydrothermal vent metagenome]|uniref:Glutamate--cysteine ligase n=1 Tax=hydrothermal vent metagenome TaxID=652676 RepID=A0A3B0XMH9_9ZZZZ
MGQEITTRHFTEHDRRSFNHQLQLETDELQQWFNGAVFSSHAPVAGYEMEAWLVDAQSAPAACNEAFLNTANNPLYTAELAQFNIELNAEPVNIQSNFLSGLEQDFQRHWLYCQSVAESIDCRILSTGILQTLKNDDLNMANISRLIRYQALNDQVLKQRKGRPLQLKINGKQSLDSIHQNVMIEAAATSLQIHLQVPLALSTRYYNASLLISSVMVAVSANSPYLFGKDLWSETRIPLFEQAVNIGGYNGAAQGPIHRVGFGSGFVRQSLMECFSENLQHFPVLLPVAFTDDVKLMRHLSLHNGTIWRWNRPLVGFDIDGTPHLRIEHRVIPAGPSIVDNIANMAFYFGLVQYYALHETPPDELLDFSQVRDNFYTSAQHGLENKISWPGCERCDMRKLILHKLIDNAEAGLSRFNLDAGDIDYYLGIIQSRVEQKQTGSHWQRQFVARQGNDMRRLMETCYYNQQSGEPVHCWDFTPYV